MQYFIWKKCQATKNSKWSGNILYEKRVRQQKLVNGQAISCVKCLACKGGEHQTNDIWAFLEEVVTLKYSAGSGKLNFDETNDIWEFTEEVVTLKYSGGSGKLNFDENPSPFFSFDFEWQIEVRFFKITGFFFDFLGDFKWRIEVRFFKIQRKKNAPESPLKIVKGAIFYWFWK